jgi:hypothetical protein
MLIAFTQRDSNGTVKEEARRQENHFCQASQKDGKRQKAPQIRRHPTTEGSDANFDASGDLTTRPSRSHQAAGAWLLVPSRWGLVAGAKPLGLGCWCLAAGAWLLVPGRWGLVAGAPL